MCANVAGARLHSDVEATLEKMLTLNIISGSYMICARALTLSFTVNFNLISTKHKHIKVITAISCNNNKKNSYELQQAFSWINKCPHS